MRGAVASPQGPLNRVISVGLPDSGDAEHLAQELRDLFPAATIERNGSLDVAVYGVGGENRLIIEVLGAVQLWLKKEPDGTEPVRVRYRDKTYLLDADALKETFGGD
jgi:hypothetical protein